MKYDAVNATTEHNKPQHIEAMYDRQEKFIEIEFQAMGSQIYRGTGLFLPNFLVS